MSAFSTQSEPGPEGEDTFPTKDPILAATLGNLGFQAKHSLPVMLVLNPVNIVELVDRKSGRVQDCSHLEFRFEARIMHPYFGQISGWDVCHAHEISKLAQKEQTREISGAESHRLSELRRKWDRRVIGGNGTQNGPLLWAVQFAYDQVTNFFVICSVVKELSGNPMVQFSQRVQKGVAYAVEPLEAEPQVRRRGEKLMRQ